MTSLSLPADLGIEHVASLHAQLLGLLHDTQDVALDGAAVERVHGASLQVLHAFARDRAAAGHATALIQASTPLADAVRLLALADRLGLAHTAETRP